MEQIIKTLIEIDLKSSKIVEAATNEKNNLSEFAKKRREDYKKSADENALKQIEKLRTQLNEQMNQELRTQSKNANQKLTNMDEEYEAKHNEIAQNIFNSLIQ